MTQSASPATRPFRFIAGDPGLDFVNTVDWTGNGPQHERMPDYFALLAWSEAAGLMDPATRAQLQVRAESDPAGAAKAYGEAMILREELRAVWTALLENGNPTPEQLVSLEGRVATARRHRRLGPRGRGRKSPGLEWVWEAAGADLQRPLWPLALATLELLLSGEVDRVRMCPGPDCGWFYVDRSRNGLRRWCAMDMCGAREKARRHYARARNARGRARNS